MNHVCRITRPADQLSDLFATWAKVSGQVLAYQHDADDKVKTTHCHVLIQGCKIGQEGLRKRALKILTLYGNEDWSFAQDEFDATKNPIRYMTKGKYDPVYNKGYHELLIQSEKAAWIDHDKKPEPQIIHQIPDKIKEDTSLQAVYLQYEDDILGNDISKLADNLTIDYFRGPSIKWWRKRCRLMPVSSTYKRFLVSVYLEYKDLKRAPLDLFTIEEVTRNY